MNKQESKAIDIEEIAEMAQRGEDVSTYFTGQPTAKQRLFVDFPLRLLRLIDAECRALDISRQIWMRPRRVGGESVTCDSIADPVEVHARSGDTMHRLCSGPIVSPRR